MHLCIDCNCDISHMDRRRMRCASCKIVRRNMLLRKRRRKNKETDVCVDSRIREMVTLDRKCSICGKPVYHYLADATQCYLCRKVVLRVSDSLCEGATGDPAYYPGDNGWFFGERNDEERNKQA